MTRMRDRLAEVHQARRPGPLRKSRPIGLSSSSSLLANTSTSNDHQVRSQDNDEDDEDEEEDNLALLSRAARQKPRTEAERLRWERIAREYAHEVDWRARADASVRSGGHGGGAGGSGAGGGSITGMGKKMGTSASASSRTSSASSSKAGTGSTQPARIMSKSASTISKLGALLKKDSQFSQSQEEQE